MGDLWSVKNVKQKAKNIIKKRGYKVKKVFDLTTGLWISVKLFDNSIVNVYDYEIH